MPVFYMLMTLIRSRLQGAEELKPFISMQVQDRLRFIDFRSEREACFLYVRSFYKSHVHTFKR